MSPDATVMGALRRFLPEFLQGAPALSQQQRRAIWALTHCRTAALGGRAFGCQRCGHLHFAYHSCNHKACPQCGARATAAWIQQQLAKRINAPYFLVTFTLPCELRDCFFGPLAHQAYNLFFGAVSGALTQKLASAKGLRALVNGFTAVLHTWNQRLEFHPHIHCLVPGAGLNARGQPVRVKRPNFLLHLPHLQAAFRQRARQLFEQNHWQVDPQVWRKTWGVHIQPVGSGAGALKYLGTYIARTAIGDQRILPVTEQSVTFRWKDRSDHNRQRELSLPGIEFVARYLRHVLPGGLRSVRYYGFCHPAAKANRLRLRLHTGLTVDFGACTPAPGAQPSLDLTPQCPNCGQLMRMLFRIRPPYRSRGPPRSRPLHQDPCPQLINSRAA